MDKSHKDYFLTRETISQGHFDNLVMEDDFTRIWVSRVEEGADGKPLVTIEHLIEGVWQIVDKK